MPAYQNQVPSSLKKHPRDFMSPTSFRHPCLRSVEYHFLKEALTAHHKAYFVSQEVMSTSTRKYTLSPLRNYNNIVESFSPKCRLCRLIWCKKSFDADSSDQTQEKFKSAELDIADKMTREFTQLTTPPQASSIPSS